MADLQSRRFYNPERVNPWQDWANVVLAIWLFISPWILQFGRNVAQSTTAPAAGTAAATVTPVASGGMAAWNAWILGIIIFLVAVSAMGRFALSQEWANLLLGIWVFVAPWVLGFVALSAAAWDHWIVGVLVFLVSLSAMYMTRADTRLNVPPSERTNLR
jgi:hypothetical protein